MPKLTKRTVDAAKPLADGREYVLWDGGLPGFGLRIKPSGVRSYIIQYRNREGHSRKLTLGRHGVKTPDEARKLARRLLSSVKDGADPAAMKAEARQALTVAELADVYLAEGPIHKPNKKASSWEADRSNIERHIKPLLGHKTARSLTQAEVARFQADVAEGKTADDQKTGFRGRAIVKGGKGTAARSLSVLAALLQFGVNQKLLPSNPAKGVKHFKGRSRERFLSEMEVTKLAGALTEMEAERAIHPVMAAAIRLLMLTGCRKSEILTLRWESIDFERAGLRLRDSKTGAKVVPVAAVALELLSRLPRTSKWVFPATRGAGPVVGLQKVWEQLRDRAELPGLRLHDLRHSFASFAVADGHSLYLIGKVLGHRQARTTEVYAHLAADPLRAVADRTATRIATAMKSGNGRPNVVFMPSDEA